MAFLVYGVGTPESSSRAARAYGICSLIPASTAGSWQRGECPELSDLFRGVVSKDGVVKEGKTDLDAGHAVVDRCGDQVRVFDRVVETLGDRHHCHQCDQNDRYQQNPSRELVVEQPVCHVGSIGTMTPETDFPLVHWVNEPRVMYLSRVVRG